MFSENQVTIGSRIPPSAWAARFGRKVIDGLIANQSLEYIEYYTRLAASYGRMALDEQEHAVHRADVLAWYR